MSLETGEQRYENYVEFAKGEPENLITWDEIVEKFEELTDHLALETRDDTLKVVRSLERRTVGKLTKLFADHSRTKELTSD